MKSHARILFVFGLLVGPVVGLGAACGGKSSSRPATAAPATPAAGAATAEVTRFHDVLAPRWHAEKGSARMTGTCSDVPTFKARAAVLAGTSAPPSSQAASWTHGTQELTAAVAALESSCAAGDAARFEASFTYVHKVFHAIMELADVKHEGPGHDAHHPHDDAPRDQEHPH